MILYFLVLLLLTCAATSASADSCYSNQLCVWCGKSPLCVGECPEDVDWHYIDLADGFWKRPEGFGTSCAPTWRKKLCCHVDRKDCAWPGSFLDKDTQYRISCSFISSTPGAQDAKGNYKCGELTCSVRDTYGKSVESAGNGLLLQNGILHGVIFGGTSQGEQCNRVSFPKTDGSEAVGHGPCGGIEFLAEKWVMYRLDYSPPNANRTQQMLGTGVISS